jgi:hypothetical protein
MEISPSVVVNGFNDDGYAPAILSLEPQNKPVLGIDPDRPRPSTVTF